MTPGRETGSLRLDTRRLARQQTWDHLELIKLNYNNYINMTHAMCGIMVLIVKNNFVSFLNKIKTHLLNLSKAI